MPQSIVVIIQSVTHPQACMGFVAKRTILPV